MELSEVVLSRRMVRRYDPDRPVPEEVVERLVRHAVRAPSAGFSQGFDLLVLASADERERFWSATADPPPPAPAVSGAGTPPTGDTADDTPEDTPEDTTGAGRGWLAGMRTAPLLVVLLSDPAAYRGRYAAADKQGDPARRADRDPDAWPVAWWDVDTGMAGLLMLLTAVDAGLGGCLFGVPPARHDAVREAFGVPADRRLVGVVSVGHPAAGSGGRARAPSRPVRRPLSEVVHRGRFGA